MVPGSDDLVTERSGIRGAGAASAQVEPAQTIASLLEDGRYEVKFVTGDPMAWKLRHWLKLHPAGFRVAYPARRVNNVYFDTDDFTTYWENLTGISARTKVRYRWYGERLEPGPGGLELKGKRNSLGWKRIFPVVESPWRPGASWRAIRRNLLASLPHLGRLWLEEHPIPVLINSYRREYYVSADGLVRVTLDLDQGVWDQRFSPHPNLTRAANLPRCVVVEAKCARGDRDLASRVLQGIPIRVSRHSKYVTGVRAVSGN
jgi:hypothetical protein